jgi:O-antigen ligase
MLSLILFYGLAAVVAVGGLLYLVAAPIVVTTHLARLDRIMPPLVASLACALLLAGGLLNERNLRFVSYGAAFVEAEGSYLYFWASRAASVFLLATAVPYLVGKFLVFVRSNERVSWPVVLTLIFGVASYLLPAFFGTNPRFDHRLVYPLVIVLVVLVGAPQIRETVSIIKWALAAFFAISLSFIFIDQSRVLAPGFVGFLPGVSFRFWGLANHANAIGPMAGACLLLEAFVPSRTRLASGVIAVLALATLVLSQSKTAMLATVIGVLVIFYIRSMKRSQSDNRLTQHTLHKGQIAVLIGVIAVIGALLVASLLGVLEPALARFGSTKMASEVQTLTGRDVIWSVAFEEWLQNPWFGYGAGLWNAEYRRQIGLNYAFHAHNQFVQSLAESGLFGAISLVVLVCALGLASLKIRRPTGGASVALVGFLFVRGITEVPMRPSGIGTGEMLLLIALFAMWRLSRLPEDAVHAAVSDRK